MMMNFCFPYNCVNLPNLPKGRLNLSASVGKLDSDFYRKSDFPNFNGDFDTHSIKTLAGFFYSFQGFRYPLLQYSSDCITKVRKIFEFANFFSSFCKVISLIIKYIAYVF